MIRPAELRVGDVVWVAYPEGMEHLAVVLALHAGYGRAHLAMGTGTYRQEYGPYTVSEKSREGQAMRLTKTTHFYRDNCLTVPYSDVRPRGGRCPPALLLKLQAVCAGTSLIN